MKQGYVLLEDRAVLVVAGDDRVAFLQGLVTADVRRATADQTLWAGLLTPQGKYLHDFFVMARPEALWLDCEAARMMDLGQRLQRYRLRSAIRLEPGQGLAVYALPGAAPAAFGLGPQPGAATPWAGGLLYVDPRHAGMGLRLAAPAAEAEAALRGAGFAPVPRTAHETARLALGLPDGSRDMEPGKALPLENGFDELGGIDWRKGCYMGQELTARTRYRALLRRRLLPVRLSATGATPGTPVMAGADNAGDLRSIQGDQALAMIRLDCLEKALDGRLQLTAGGLGVTALPPAWMKLPPT